MLNFCVLGCHLPTGRLKVRNQTSICNYTIPPIKAPAYWGACIVSGILGSHCPGVSSSSWHQTRTPPPLWDRDPSSPEKVQISVLLCGCGSRGKNWESESTISGLNQTLEFSTLKFSHLPLTHPQTVLVTLLGGLHSLGVTSGSLSLPLPAPAPEESPLHHWLPAHDALPILSCLISTSLWSYKLIPFLFFCCKYSIIKAASGVKHIFTLLLLVTSSALFNLSLGRFLKLSHHHNLDTVLTWWTCTGHTWFSQSWIPRDDLAEHFTV